MSHDVWAGVNNPIHLARTVLDYSRRSDPLGRIPPLCALPCTLELMQTQLLLLLVAFCRRTLVSSGAHSFAQNHVKNNPDSAVHVIPPDALTAPAALRDWRRWTARLQVATANSAALDDPDLRQRQDTVGAVAMDAQGRVAAGVSRFACCNRCGIAS